MPPHAYRAPLPPNNFRFGQACREFADAPKCHSGWHLGTRRCRWFTIDSTHPHPPASDPPDLPVDIDRFHRAWPSSSLPLGARRSRGEQPGESTKSAELSPSLSGVSDMVSVGGVRDQSRSRPRARMAAMCAVRPKLDEGVG